MGVIGDCIYEECNRWTLKCGLYLDKRPGREAYTIREVSRKNGLERCQPANQADCFSLIGLVISC